MLNFDKKGFLEPYSNIPCSLEICRQVFLLNMPNESRQQLFDGLLQFFSGLFDLTRLDNIQVWVDGSFASKKQNPKDIDLVYFVDAATANGLETQLATCFSYPASLQLYGIDAYIVKVFDDDHAHFVRTQSDKLYWFHQFTKTRKNRRGVAYSKGFLEINLSQYEIR